MYAIRSYYESRVSLGQPPEDEKRPPDVVGVEQVQQPGGRLLDPAGKPVPVLPLHVVREGLDLEILLHVDREDLSYNFV